MGETNRIEYKSKLTPELDIENKVAATITSVERIETPMWDKVALREAVINAIVHNDYSFEVPPKFEIFPDRFEITSAGRLPESLSREEFFNGISIPRNKELMRIYRDVELVESLGSGIPRILRVYGEDCFKFTDNFIRITFPINNHYSVSAHDHASVHASDHASDHASVQIKNLLLVVEGEMERARLQELLGIKNRDYFRTNYLNPAITDGYVELTIPDKPNSQNQKYRLTSKGLQLKVALNKQNKEKSVKP